MQSQAILQHEHRKVIRLVKELEAV